MRDFMNIGVPQSRARVLSVCLPVAGACTHELVASRVGRCPPRCATAIFPRNHGVQQSGMPKWHRLRGREALFQDRPRRPSS